MTKYKSKRIFQVPDKYAEYHTRNIIPDESNHTYSCNFLVETPEAEGYRDIFSRDRDRILYCNAFLRLALKTQVFKANQNDHLRTRLTHTLEVAQIARTMAAELGLNMELTEAIALGHDIGHTPFGHAGERQLNSVSQNELHYIKDDSETKYNKTHVENYRGFKHNQQGVRVLVDFSNDLKLTNFCLYGIRNHSRLSYPSGDDMSFYDQYDAFCSFSPSSRQTEQKPSWSFEAAVVGWADEIAQRHHDIEDAYREKIIDEDQIIEIVESLMIYFDSDERTIKDFNSYCEKDHFKKKLSELKHSKNDEKRFKKNLATFVVDFYVSATIRELLYAMKKIADKKRIGSHKVFVEKYPSLKEKDMMRYLKFDYDQNNPFKKTDKQFQNKLNIIILPSYDVQRQDGKGSFVTRKLVKAYATNPQQLPSECLLRIFNRDIPAQLSPQLLQRLQAELEQDNFCWNLKTWNEVDARRAIKYCTDIPFCYEIIYPFIFRGIFDYIAGMTDTFAENEYNNLY